MDPRYFLDPLGFLRTELYRQRVTCNTLEALASSDTSGDVRADAERVLRFFSEDLPAHIADLEECLIPLLDQRALPADNVKDVLAHYRNEQGVDDKPVERLVMILRRVAEGDAPPIDLQPDARAFAEMRRRYLAVENDVILPLAEKRFMRADLETLGQAMARRRGVPYPR